VDFALYVTISYFLYFTLHLTYKKVV
jgi:hypothetical protein